MRVKKDLPNGPVGQHYCIVISSLGAGGAERVIAKLSRHWIAQSNRLTVISFDRPEEPIYHAFAEGVRFERLGIPSIAGSKRNFFAPITRLIKELVDSNSQDCSATSENTPG